MRNLIRQVPLCFALLFSFFVGAVSAATYLPGEPRQSSKQDAATLFENALAWDKLGMLEKADQAYQELKGLGYSESAVCYNHALVLRQLGRYDDAHQSINRAAELDPDWDTYGVKGEILAKLNRDVEALAAFDRSLRYRSDVAFTFYNRGLVLNKLGRLEDAKASLERAIELKSDHSRSYGALGLVLTEMGMEREGNEAIDRALELMLVDERSESSGMGD